MEDRDWQRLDKFLWCARVLKSRADCAALAATGMIRINRQVTEKPHARLRVGDVLTLVFRNEIKVWRVVALAARRGPPAEAATLYDEILEPPSCAAAGSSAYPSQIGPPQIGLAPGDQR